MKGLANILSLGVLVGGAPVAAGQGARELTLVAHNPTAIMRAAETLELEWSELARRLPGLEPGRVAVRAAGARAAQIIQVIDLDGDGGADQLIFQAGFAPQETRRFTVSSADGPRSGLPAARVFGRYVPERKDDFAWENDRIAFRVYGPALAAEGAGSGIDVWVKSVRHPVIDAWYRGGDYHGDHGEGLDYYTVGASRGCGGVGILAGGQLHVSTVYASQRRIACGPLRVAFELEYAPWAIPGGTVHERKRISLDAGASLCRVESLFTADPEVRELPVAVGIVEREGEGIVAFSPAAGWLSYWEPEHPRFGSTGCGAVLADARAARVVQDHGHLLLVGRAVAGEVFVHHVGACWSNGLDFQDPEAWSAHLRRAAACIHHPIQIEYK